jgi:uncharacterized metal-binding protein YceD (DUF177 family)
MKALIGYVIPFSGLKNGIHHFDFQVDNNFFQHFEGSLIGDSDLKVHLQFDKRASLFVLDFEFEGTVKTPCDRCTEPFDLMIEGEEQFLVKMSETGGEDDEIIYIHPTDTSLDVSTMIYEILHLNLPLKRACELDDDSKPVCGFEVSDFSVEEETDETGEKSSDNNDDVWTALKKFKDDLE